MKRFFHNLPKKEKRLNNEMLYRNELINKNKLM